MASHKLPPLPSLRDFIYIYRLSARKVLSQNYLMDMNINHKIVRKAGIKKDAFVVEVGPGPGGLTRAILERPISRCDVIEKDQRFLPVLEALIEASERRLFIHHGDALKFDIAPIWDSVNAQRHDWLDDSPNLHIIGNLPFDISIPLIIRYLKEMSRRQGPWAFGRVPLTVTFQLEVAKRICGEISTAERSRISMLAQWVSEPSLVYQISGQSFTPKPNVDVGLVRFMPRLEPLVSADFDTLYPPDLGDELAEELFRKASVNPHKTSYDVGMEELADLCYVYEEQCRRYPGLILFYYTNKKHSLEKLENEPNAIPREYGYETSDLNKEGVSLKEFDANWLGPITRDK